MEPKWKDIVFKLNAVGAVIFEEGHEKRGKLMMEAAAEIIRLRARLAEAEAAKADAWDEAMSVVIAALPGFPATHQDGALLRAEIMSAPCFVNAIRALVNPYRSKNDEPQ